MKKIINSPDKVVSEMLEGMEKDAQGPYVRKGA